MARQFVELNHAIEDGMAPYPGLPAPRVAAIVDHEQSRPRYQGKAEFHIGRIEMAGNTATYLDCPFHRYRDGADLSEVPLNRVAALPGLVLDATGFRAINAPTEAAEMEGRAVLLRTNWDARWGSPSYWELGPYISRELLGRLVRARPALVGVDFWNVDDVEDPVRPVHTQLLGAGILVVENLANLAALPREGFRFSAVPLRIVRGASIPVRAFAEIG